MTDGAGNRNGDQHDSHGDQLEAVVEVKLPQTGEHQDGRTTYGHSLVVGPWGEVLLDMGDAAGLGLASIDGAQVDAVRERLPAIRHRRAIGPVTLA